MLDEKRLRERLQGSLQRDRDIWNLELMLDVRNLLKQIRNLLKKGVA